MRFTIWSNVQLLWTGPVSYSSTWSLRLPGLVFAHNFSGTGEHGVGIGKRDYLYEELGEGTVELMKAIKRTIDPLGLFNPGKVGTFK